MKIYWSLKQIPELSGCSWQERQKAFRRFAGFMFATRPNRWSISAHVALIGLLLGGAFASSFLSDFLGAFALAVGSIAGFYLHYLISLNYMSRCFRGGAFRM